MLEEKPHPEHGYRACLGLQGGRFAPKIGARFFLIPVLASAEERPRGLTPPSQQNAGLSFHP
jgi:hypothetical protein